MRPTARTDWLGGAPDVVTDEREAKTVVDVTSVARCRRDEWRLGAAWDES
jgi:hypothetical protein